MGCHNVFAGGLQNASVAFGSFLLGTAAIRGSRWQGRYFSRSYARGCLRRAVSRRWSRHRPRHLIRTHRVDGAAATTPAAAAGCGTYCQQAGTPRGPVPGYPCSKAGCLRCPPQNCVSLESGGATATNGVATVKLSCNLSTACHGAFLHLLATGCLRAGRTRVESVVASPGRTSWFPRKPRREVGVALTALGKQVASGPRGFRATVFVDLLDYGTVLDPGHRAERAISV